MQGSAKRVCVLTGGAGQIHKPKGMTGLTCLDEVGMLVRSDPHQHRFQEVRPQNEIRGRMDALRRQISDSVFTAKDLVKVRNGRNLYRYATPIQEYSGPAQCESRNRCESKNGKVLRFAGF